MNKNVILSVFCCISLFSASFVQAQMLNVDAPETVSDSSNLIGKVTDHVKEAQKYIENSQFGKAIGDGIKYAKQGMAYAKEGYTKAMEYYNQGMAYKNELVNSPEYKIAKKSAEIALLETKLKELEKQQEQAEQETDDKISLVQAEADAKIKNLNKNMANVQIMMADGDNEQARAMAQNINNEIAQIRQETANKVAVLQSELQQKTGVAPQQNKAISVEQSDEDENRDTETTMDWEILGQNADDVVSALKPGVRMTDKLSVAQKPLLQKAQSQENLALTSKTLQQNKLKQPVASAQKISGVQKARTTIQRIKE